jgi:acyl carrier protein
MKKVIRLKGKEKMDINEQIRTFVKSNFYVSDPTTLADGASLLDRGIIDSTGVLEVISFIEETFDIKVKTANVARQPRFYRADRELYCAQEKLRPC